MLPGLPVRPLWLCYTTFGLVVTMCTRWVNNSLCPPLDGPGGRVCLVNPIGSPRSVHRGLWHQATTAAALLEAVHEVPDEYYPNM